ncbi:MAG: 30S ribosome-binding factor RbfA [Pseudomonadota bacterium]|nr:30S ribosome-binding factor RbfA [Pseudomonadota bacterium]
MSSRRAERIASIMHAELARLIREEVKDPRVGTISITEVVVKADLGSARVRYLPLGGVGNRTQVQAGLEAAARYLRGPIGRALGIRHAPELKFELDPNVEYAAKMDALFRTLPIPADVPSEEPASGAASGAPGADAAAVEPADGGEE